MRASSVLFALFLAACGSHVSEERCMQFHERAATCEYGRPLTEDDRATLRGAYCAHEVDRDSNPRDLDCLDTPDCDGFQACIRAHHPGPSPFGVAH
jgi:hypothetical protein